MSRRSERRASGAARQSLTILTASALLAAVGHAAAANAQQPVVVDTAPRDTLPRRTAPRDSATRDPAVGVLPVDRLRLVSIGATMGQAWPAQARSAQLYSVHADYGELARNVRLVFVASYWGTYYSDAVVRDLERALDAAVDGTGTVRLGRIRLSNVSLGTEARWRLGGTRQVAPPRTMVRPWIGGGIAFHFLDAEGPAIDATFVEGALDAVTAGLAGAVGADIFLLPNLSLTMQARYDLFGGARHASVRAGASYAFEPAGAR